MVSPIYGRAVIGINATVKHHWSIIPEHPSAHGLTGCDTVATYFGIGKGVALKVLRGGLYPLSYLGDTSHSLSEVASQATPFILACYGQNRSQSLTKARLNVWASKVGRSVAGAPKLASLPPSDQAFNENVARYHLQIVVRRNALQPEPPELDPSAVRHEPQNGPLVPARWSSERYKLPQWSLRRSPSRQRFVLILKLNGSFWKQQSQWFVFWAI
jgi:hypothetical protein